MLTTVKHAAREFSREGRFAIIASQYNARYVEGMLHAAEAVLAKAEVSFQVVRVPGAFEIPVVAAKLASARQRWSALICLGVILRGETTHAQHIGETVSLALAQIQIQYHVPVIHEVLLLENAEQAEVRCLAPKHNRGAEAAVTALEMAKTMAALGRVAGVRNQRGKRR
jgi:6,7-dimethyl-8-ribityllumazine synthase